MEAPMASRGEIRRVAERVYWREADARVVVEAWRDSGERLSGFARRHGVDPRRLARWVKRLPGAEGNAVRFHRVRLVERGPGAVDGARIEIHLARGERVYVPRDFEAEDLRRVLAVLREEGRC
jgi:transposase-like protein